MATKMTRHSLATVNRPVCGEAERTEQWMCMLEVPVWMIVAVTSTMSPGSMPRVKVMLPK